MSFITFGQSINGNICTCKAMCMTTCLCGCPACANVVASFEASKPVYFSKEEALTNDWIKVNNSSNILGYKYDEQSMTLQVSFTNGSCGSYVGVTPEDYNLLQHATSKGKFISNIIKAKYKYEKHTSTVK